MTDQKQCAKLKNIKCFLFDMDGTITDYDYVMTDAVANGGIVPYVVE